MSAGSPPRTASALALVAIGLLGAVALVRGVTLELDPFDGYEIRSSARAIAGDKEAPFAIYRSPLLVLAAVPFEKWARGSRATWVAPHLLSALAYVALALGARRLARAAGARPATAAVAGVALALDRLAFADAPLGLPDGLAAALATWGLALGLEERFRSAALLLGLAAATRPNDGIACLGLLVACGPGIDRRAVASCAGAVLIFFVLTASFFALGGQGALHGFVALREFQTAQFAENFEKYGRDHPRVLVYLHALFAMEPGTALLAPVALALARGRKALALVAVVLVHAVFLTTLVGHGEARYLLPALPPLAALGALALDRVTNVNARRLLLGAWLALPLLLGLREETDRVRDGVFSRNPSREIAEAVAALSPSGRVYYAPDLPAPVYPRLLARGGTPFPGDPFHGIGHLGHLTIGYHLGKTIYLLQPRDGRGAAPVAWEWLPGVLGDPRFQEGDVLIARSGPHVSWLLGEEPPEIRLYRIRPRLELVARWRFSSP